ncbi:MAG: hypothetical protein D6694_02870 [Gammaproteobacteria bacterium]|nr:MAG: hypothetical protein D6694_02870 [Gammaproteobacteria bacterium]
MEAIIDAESGAAPGGQEDEVSESACLLAAKLSDAAGRELLVMSGRNFLRYIDQYREEGGVCCTSTLSGCQIVS